MSLLNPRQFFSRKSPVVQVSTGAPVLPQAVDPRVDLRSDEQKAADQDRFDTVGLPSRMPRHRA